MMFVLLRCARKQCCRGVGVAHQGVGVALEGVGLAHEGVGVAHKVVAAAHKPLSGWRIRSHWQHS